MTTLQNIISDIRIFIYGGMRTLPITIAGTMTILGLFTANYAIMFFLIGFLLITPFIAYWLNVAGIRFLPATWVEVESTDICDMVIPYKTRYTHNNDKFKPVKATSAFSAWVAMLSFFIGYIFTNGCKLYIYKSDQDQSIDPDSPGGPLKNKDNTEKTNNRKYTVAISMASILLFALIALGYRFYTGCDTIWMILLSSILFASLGAGWYEVISLPGDNRLSDIFGIATRIILPSAGSKEPTACVPT